MTFFQALSVAGLFGAVLTQSAAANTTSIIMQGTVVMIDGSAPPKPPGIERLCSDTASVSGPLADKQGRFVWRQELDPMAGRACYIQATLQGFSSTQFDMKTIPLSSYSGSGVITLPNLVLSPRDGGDLHDIILPAESEVPGKAANAWKAGVKSLKAENFPEAITHFQEAMQSTPKFADGWNLLSALYEQQHMLDKARDAIQRTLEANPKLIGPYLRLARVCDETGDWDAAAKAADALLKVDKRFYPEIYLHQAIARLGLKDLAGAESSANQAISLDAAQKDAAHKMPRAEYVLGRILQAKGDAAGAREHISRYLEIDPGALDSSQIKVLLEYIGKPDAPALETGLERPY
jgi:tetratricopeptide (TPR) repeat protein